MKPIVFQRCLKILLCLCLLVSSSAWAFDGHALVADTLFDEADSASQPLAFLPDHTPDKSPSHAGDKACCDHCCHISAHLQAIFADGFSLPVNNTAVERAELNSVLPSISLSPDLRPPRA